MLRTLRDLEGYTIHATDGDIGSVSNFLIDDQHWSVRYLVAETGTFFDRSPRLIPVISFARCDWTTRRFHVLLTRDRVKNAPSVDTDKPVSRQHESAQLTHYGYPFYWGLPGSWGMGGYPELMTDGRPTGAPSSGDAHLRSVREVRGYGVHGADGTVGHIDDFIVDDETWQIRYLVVDTNNWWHGKRVLIAPRWASGVSWGAREVHMSISRQSIKASPAWNALAPISREYEQRLYDHYGRPVHWKNGEQVAL